MLVSFISKLDAKNILQSICSIIIAIPIRQTEIQQFIYKVQNIFFWPTTRIEENHTNYCGNISINSYIKSNIYILKREDILFYVNWIIKNNFFNFVKQNNIHSINLIYLKKISNLNSNVNILLTQCNTEQFVRKIKSLIQSKIKLIYFQSLSKQGISETLLNKKCSKTNNSISSVKVPVKKISVVSSNKSIKKSIYLHSKISEWVWPTKGRVIKNFSSIEKGNKGIDIVGNKGQAIVAITDGYVVYAGSAIHGYGNLIIIKHKDNYLSAYAHNDKIIIQVRQKVKTGQKIATMGNTGTNSTHLHFEIYYKGKSVDPLQYLPY